MDQRRELRPQLHELAVSQVRGQPDEAVAIIFAYNLANFVRRLGLLESNKTWSMTSVQAKLIKTG